jgi:hypothetical protein
MGAARRARRLISAGDTDKTVEGHEMTKKRLILSILTGALLSLSAATASAEYVCSATYRVFSSSLGSHGYITLNFYTDPACGGSFISTRYLCTVGATSTLCGVASSQRTDSQIQTEMQLLQHALDRNIRVGLLNGSCMGGGASCLSTIAYYGD